jgi:hypothetical protein
MKTINRYSIENELGVKFATYLDADEAFLRLAEAQRGVMKKMGWRGEEFFVVEYKAEISKNTGTFIF